MLFIIIAVVLVATVMVPDMAAAWGPSTHLLVGRHVLDTVSSNGAAVGPLLASHPLDFLYGSIFADMNLGKKFLFFAKLAHNWRVGFRLLDYAETDANRSCAYGYLAHLAADTVSHNDYVPRKLVQQYHKKGKGHIYFEIAFDALLPEDPYKEVGKVVKTGAANNNRFLESSIRRTLLSFNTNRKLFNGILKINGNNGVRAYRDWRAKKVDFLTDEDIQRYLGICESRVTDFLYREKESECCASDPHGKATLKHASRLRRYLREKKRQNNITPEEVTKALENLRTRHIEKH